MYKLNQTCSKAKFKGRRDSASAKKALTRMPGIMALVILLTGCQSWTGWQGKAAAPYFEVSQLSGLSACHTSDQVLVTRIAANKVTPVYIQPSTQQHTPALPDDAQGEAVACFPHDARILLQRFSARDSGNHLLVHQPEGQILDITPGVGIQARFLGWDIDGRYFYVAQISPGSPAEEIYRYRSDTFQRSKIFDNANNLTIRGISSNGRYVVTEYQPGVPGHRIVVADTTYPEARLLPLSLSKAHRHISPLGFIDNQLIFVSDAQSRTAQAWRYNLQTGAVAQLTSFDAAVKAMAVSPSGQLVFEILDQGIARLVMTDESGQPMLQPDWPEGNLTDPVFSNDDSHLYFYRHTDTQQSAPMSLDITTMTVSPASNPQTLPGDLIGGSRVWLDAPQGRVPATLFKPRTLTRAVPAMVVAHDELHSHFTRQYNPQIQHLLASGIAVLAVDYHGSDGYSSAYQHSAVKQHGEVDTQDLILAGQYLAAQKWVNARQIGVLGTGYGGFLSLSAVSRSSPFSVAVSYHGMVDWLQYLQSIPPSMADFARFMRYEIGDPASRASLLQRISPLYQADQISTPVMLVQGGRDPQVSEAQTRQLAEKLNSRNIPVQYLLFPAEAHGLSLQNNQIEAQERLLAFLQEYWEI